MKAYRSIFCMRWRMETQYRAAALGGMLCQMFFGLILVALYRALYAGKPQSMPIENVVTYVWFQQAFFRMLTSTDDELAARIRTGSIAYDLCRPLDMYNHYYVRAAAQKLVGSGLRAAPMLLIAFLLPKGWAMELPCSWAALGTAISGLVLGLMCVCALDNITMAFTMHTLDNKGMQTILSMLSVTLSGNLLPLTLFPDSWQKVIVYLPHSQLLDAPIRLYTGEWPLSAAPRVLLVQAVWCVALMVLGRYMWHREEKRLIVQGG